jgi:hypothetical protein
MRTLVQSTYGRIVDSASQIIAGITNRHIQRMALRWRIEAALRETHFQPWPLTWVFDTPVLTFQMHIGLRPIFAAGNSDGDFHAHHRELVGWGGCTMPRQVWRTGVGT